MNIIIMRTENYVAYLEHKYDGTGILIYFVYI